MAARALIVVMLCLAFAARASAQDDGRWAVTIWGVSYHVDDTIDYDAVNWGAGLRRYLTPRVFVEGDALKNSNRGLVASASVGFELRLATMFRACDVVAVGALTAAYYDNF